MTTTMMKKRKKKKLALKEHGGTHLQVLEALCPWICPHCFHTTELLDKQHPIL